MDISFEDVGKVLDLLFLRVFPILLSVWLLFENKKLKRSNWEQELKVAEIERKSLKVRIPRGDIKERLGKDIESHMEGKKLDAKIAHLKKLLGIKDT